MLGLSNKALSISGSLLGATSLGVGITYLTDNSKTQETVTANNKARKDDTKLSTNEKISDLLNKENRILLVGEEAEWNQNWTTFKAKYSADKGPEAPWQISSWDNAFSASGVSADFKKRCTENSGKEVENNQNSLYKEVKEYCTKDKPAEARAAE